MITLIVAVSENHGIGIDGKLPWDIPEDMKRFRKHTLNKSVIMGRNTYESIGRPLPKRENIVVTSGSGIPGCLCVTSLPKAIEIASKEIMIIGGERVYRSAMRNNLVDRVLLTKVHSYYKVDTRFLFLPSQWGHCWEQTWEESHDGFTFLEYQKDIREEN